MDKNTGIDTVIEGKFAMLAQKSGDRELDFENHTYFIQPKLDGVRCIIRKDGAFSRNGKSFKNVEHILEELKPLFDYAPELILDGELYNHDLKEDFNQIISLVRKTKRITEEDRERSRELIQFHNYDIFDINRQGLTYVERLDLMRHVQRKYNLLYTRAVSTQRVNNKVDINLYNKINKQQGYEGSMVRNNMPYEPGKRSWTLQKVKEWQDTEFTITDYVEGKGKFEGGIGKWLGFDKDGRDVEVPIPSITIAERKELFNNVGDYIGKEATFQYFERTSSGAYRFPRFKCFRDYE